MVGTRDRDGGVGGVACVVGADELCRGWEGEGMGQGVGKDRVACGNWGDGFGIRVCDMGEGVGETGGWKEGG